MKKSIALLLVMCFCLATFAQTKSIKGTVVDKDNLPLAGVSVIIKGTRTSTITNVQGKFELPVTASAKSLVFSFIGYKTVEKTIGTSSEFRLVMDENNVELNEMVVIGYGVQKKKLVTGATSQVKGSDIERQNTISPVDALKSTTSGVQIIKASGQPGSGYLINIRGAGTNSDPTPLFIVDGMPVDNIDFLNPSDIESTDILKDAASAAIYGSRAANGIVLITTKKGNFKSKPTISYDGYYGIQNVYKNVSVLDAKQYAQIMSEAQANDGNPAFNYPSLVPRWTDIQSGKWSGTNWLKEITKKDAPIQNHSVSVNGGSETTTYALGFSYTSQSGIFGKPVTPQYDRYNVRYNGSQIILKNNGFDLLKLGESMVYSYTEKSGISEGDMYSNSLRNMLSACPFQELYDAAGNYTKSIDWDSRLPNPVGLMVYTQGKNVSKGHKVVANFYAELEPIKNLKFKSSFGYHYDSGTSRSFSDSYDLSSWNANPDNVVSNSSWSGVSLSFENTLNYKFKKDKHNFDFLVGNTIEKDNIGSNLSGINVNSIFNDLKHAYLCNTSSTAIPGKTVVSSWPYTESKLLSYFGRFNYDYNEKYLLTLIMRGDGSSNFAANHRWGYFPSVSGGWVASNESFLESTNDWLSFLKVRASWGQNGNQNIPPFQYLSTISYIGADYYGVSKSTAHTGAYNDILINKDVKWETSEQADLGIDARFFKDKMELTLDWYKKTTKNWLVDAPVLASYGTGAPYINGGDIENKGFEIGLKWRDKIGKFNYGVGGNLSYNKNKVTRIANTEGILHGPSNVLGNGMSELFRAQVGYPIGYFWGYKTNGIFQNNADVAAYKNSKGDPVLINYSTPKPGDVRFVDTNDDGAIDDKDKVMIGDPNPDFTFGLNLDADYKGFYASITGSGVAGNQIARSYRTPDMQVNNYTTEILDRWHGEGTSTRLPSVSMSPTVNWQYVSDLYIEDGDYFRISNITLGYDFKHILKAFPVQQLKLYATVENVCTLTKYKGMDPEVGYNGGYSYGKGIDIGFYPSPRTVLIGLSVKF